MTLDLDLWPTDLKINRDHLLTKDYLPTKFEASWAKHSWVISCTRLRDTDIPTDRHTDRHTYRPTYRPTGAKQYAPPFSKGHNEKIADFFFCSPSTGIITSNQNLKIELRLHKRILSYSIFPEYCLWFFDHILTETSIENNTPFYRPSDHFIVDQMKQYNRCLLLVPDMSHNT